LSHCFAEYSKAVARFTVHGSRFYRMADNSERIAEIDELLQSGAQSVSVDGVATTLNHDTLRTERQQLRAADDTYKARRPVISRIDLSNF